MTTPDYLSEGTFFIHDRMKIIVRILRVAEGHVLVENSGYSEVIDTESFCRDYSYISVPELGNAE